MDEAISRTIAHLLRCARQRSLYPDGHPTRTGAAVEAREALRRLLAEVERVDLVISEDGLRCEEEELGETDESLRGLGQVLRDQNICGLSLSYGMTDAETDLLLDLLLPPDTGRPPDLVARLEKIEAEYLVVTTFDRGRIVPRSRLGGEWLEEDRLDGAEILQRLMAEALEVQEPVVTAAEGQQLRELLGDPAAVADAILTGVGLPTTSRHGGWGGEAGEAAIEEAEIALQMGRHRLERPDVGATAIALGLQQLGGIGSGLAPEERGPVFGQLADALREFAPEQLAYILSSDVSPADGSPDALTEAARTLTAEEIVAIFRAGGRDLAQQPSTTLHRLVERVAPTPERLRQIGPAVRQKLIEDGMDPAEFDASLGLVLKSLLDDGEGAGDRGLIGAGTRPGEAVRAARRARLAAALDRTRGPGGALDRALVCLEMLELTQEPGHPTKVMRGFRQAAAELPPDQRGELLADAVRVLNEVTSRRRQTPSKVQEEAKALLAEALGDQETDWLGQALAEAQGEDRAVLVSALARAGAKGHATLVGYLRTRRGASGENEVAEIVREMLDAEDAEQVAVGGNGGGGNGSASGRDARLVDLVFDRKCACGQAVVRALAAHGGHAAARYLTELLRRGDFGLRWAVIESIGTPKGPLVGVVGVALDDPDLAVACAAAKALGRSGDPKVAGRLMPHLRPYRVLDRRVPLSVAAALALGELRHTEAVVPLADMLHRPSWLKRSENDCCRLAAATALDKIGNAPALQALANRAEGERSEAIRRLALGARARLGPATGAPAPGERNVSHAT